MSPGRKQDMFLMFLGILLLMALLIAAQTEKAVGL